MERLGWSIVSLLMTFCLAVTLINLPFFQTWAASFLTDWVSQKTGYQVSIKSVHLAWLNSVRLGGVVALDKKGDTIVCAKEITLSYHWEALLQRNGKIETALLSDAYVAYLYDGSKKRGSIDLLITKIVALTDDGQPTPKGRKPPVFTIKEVNLSNCYFKYSDLRYDTIPKGIDYYHLDFQGITGKVKDLFFYRDTVGMQMMGLRAKELGTGLPILSLRTDFLICGEAMEFKKLDGKIGTSRLQNYLRLDYQSFEDFSDFNRKVKLKARLKESSFSWADIETIFGFGLPYIPRGLTLSGNLSGKVDSLKLANAHIIRGKESFVKGEVLFRGLPNWSTTRIKGFITSSKVLTSEVIPYTPKSERGLLQKVNYLSLKGSFNGTPTKFHTMLTAQSALGLVKTDMHIQLGSSPQSHVYDGMISTTNFHYGELINRPQWYRSLTMDGIVKGKGTTLSSVNAMLEADIKSIGLYNYLYHGINLRANLAKKKFDGQISIADDNLTLEAEGFADLNKGKEEVHMDINVMHSNPKALALYPDISSFTSVLDIDIKNFNLDDLIGTASATKTSMVWNDKSIHINEAKLSANKNAEGIRDVVLDSDVLDAKAKGKYEIAQLVTIVPSTLQEYYDALSGNLQKSIDRGLKHQNEIADFQINVLVKDINPLLEAVQLPWSIAKGTRLNGNLELANTSVLQALLASDSITYQNLKWQSVNCDLSSSKVISTGDVLASVSIASSRQFWDDNLATEKLNFDATWQGRTIKFQSNIDQQQSTNHIKLRGGLDLDEQGSVLHIDSSELFLLAKEFKVLSGSRMTFLPGKRASIEGLKIITGNTLIQSEGIIGDLANDYLRFKIDSLDLSLFDSLLIVPLKGLSSVTLDAYSLMGKPSLEGTASVKQLYLGNKPAGDLSIKYSYDSLDKAIDASANLVLNQKTIGTLSGSYYYLKDDYLDFNVTANRAPVSLLQPYLEGIIEELDGKVNGRVKLTGSLEKLAINGDVKVNDGSFLLPYTQVKYNFEHPIKIRTEGFDFSGAKLLDAFGGSATLTRGFISHDYFDNWSVDMAATLTNCLVNQTQKARDSYFYGTIYASGTGSFVGPVNDLKLTANVVSMPKTQVYLPFSDQVNVGTLSSNILFTDSRKKADSTKLQGRKIDKSGIGFEFNMDITPDAAIELIFDERAGEKISVVGSGAMKFLYDTRGDMNLIGQYQINKGTYNFTLLNTINKRFNIQPGSTISWTGNPLEGALNIQATHDLYASLTPLITEAMIGGQDRATFLAQPQYTRKYLTQVLLNLTGSVMKPDIKMDVKIKDYPQDLVLSNAVNNFESLVRSNDALLNQQIFNLFVIRSFTPVDNSTNVSTGAIAGSTISELLSNQFSNWLSQVDNNIQIQVDVNGLDATALNSLQLRLSYALLDGRLRFTRSGGFNNQQANTTGSAAMVAGDWTIDYRIDSKGHLFAKGFMRNNQVNLGTQLSSNTTTGLTFRYTKEFNSIPWLNRRKKTVAPPTIKVKPDEFVPLQDTSSSNSSNK